jgi:predicted enzyme related to lactoylglutathione lyase
MPNPVLHFQISSRQPEASAQFYSQLFAWKLSPVGGMPYHMIETEPKQGIPGGLAHATAEEPVEVTFYVQVPDVQAALEKALSLGASITQPLVLVTPELTLGMFRDPEGRSIGVMHDSRVQAELDAPVAKAVAAPAAKKSKKAKKVKEAKKQKAAKKKKKKAGRS